MKEQTYEKANLYEMLSKRMKELLLKIYESFSYMRNYMRKNKCTEDCCVSNRMKKGRVSFYMKKL